MITLLTTSLICDVQTSCDTHITQTLESVTCWFPLIELEIKRENTQEMDLPQEYCLLGLTLTSITKLAATTNKL